MWSQTQVAVTLQYSIACPANVMMSVDKANGRGAVRQTGTAARVRKEGGTWSDIVKLQPASEMMHGNACCLCPAAACVLAAGTVASSARTCHCSCGRAKIALSRWKGAVSVWKAPRTLVMGDQCSARSQRHPTAHVRSRHENASAVERHTLWAVQHL